MILTVVGCCLIARSHLAGPGPTRTILPTLRHNRLSFFFAFFLVFSHDGSSSCAIAGSSTTDASTMTQEGRCIRYPCAARQAANSSSRPLSSSGKPPTEVLATFLQGSQPSRAVWLLTSSRRTLPKPESTWKKSNAGGAGPRIAASASARSRHPCQSDFSGFSHTVT